MVRHATIHRNIHHRTIDSVQGRFQKSVTDSAIGLPGCRNMLSPEDDDKDCIFGCSRERDRNLMSPTVRHSVSMHSNNRERKPQKAAVDPITHNFWRDVITRTCGTPHHDWQHANIEPRPDGEDWISARASKVVAAEA